MLLKLIGDISSWTELETRIASLPTELERGEAFEEFCKAFFLLYPLFQFYKIYRQKEIPPSLRKQLRYPGVQDLGIDGLAVTTDGKLVAYQAKFRRDRNNIPTLRELSTFFTVSDRADWRITITNANNLPSSINNRVRHSRVLADRFDQLDADFFTRLCLYLKEQRITPSEVRIPHKTQQEAMDKALSYFKGHERGQLILPCGTGKTLTAMWIAEKIGGSRILVIVPSLALMSQTLREWAANTSIRPFRYLCLCSDTTVDLGNDSPIEHLYEMDVPVTTNVDQVSAFLTGKPSATLILFSTYQSSKVLSEATLKTDTTFDIGIFDEAHRTTGTKVGIWNLPLNDKKVPIRRRLFMTATPRIYAPHIIKKAKEEDVLVCSMDDSNIYGKPFYEMTFGTAIERGHITDYKIVVICVTDREIKEIIERGGRVITDQEHEWDAKAFAKRVALVKGINAYNLKKVFTFHGTVKGAKSFTDTGTPYGIHQVFKMLNHGNKEGAHCSTTLPQENRGLSPVSSPLMGGTKGRVKFFHINGTMSSGVRSGLMNEFKESEVGIMSNARCLIEGVDVPAVDTVAFIDPKRSLIDIVQATGRAMRKAAWKERGYIFIPVVVEENANPEKFIESSDFDTVWQVLQAMADQDHRLEDVVSQLRIMQGKGEEGTQAWKDAMTEYAERIEFYDLPTKIDKTKFINTLYTKTVEIIGKNWDFWFGLTLAYKEQFGDPNAPHGYKTPEGHKLSIWQTNQRQRKNKLSSEQIRKLDEIGFIFDPHEVKFEKRFQDTVKYKEQYGTANILPEHRISPVYKELYAWQRNKIYLYKKGKLSDEKIKRLEKIGFRFDLPTQHEESFEKGFQMTVKYKEECGDANVPRDRIPQSFKLGRWQHNIRSRKHVLSQNEIQRLEEIGFKFDLKLSHDESFERGIQETIKYKKQYGDANALWGYKTSDNFDLYRWQSNQRRTNNKLSSEEAKRLEETGFKFNLNLINERFEKGFNETLKYKELFGDANAPISYKTHEGYALGKWQSHLRDKYKKGKLSPERIKRLEDIGFRLGNIQIKLPSDESFERGFTETKKYKEQHGNANVPHSYKTSQGYKLGQWQAYQRLLYKKGKLGFDKAKKLEKIGLIRNFKEESFEKGFQETVKYKKQFGDPSAPQSYKTPEGFKLGSWQSTKRQAYKQVKLSVERIKRLEEIEFKWQLKKQ